MKKTKIVSYPHRNETSQNRAHNIPADNDISKFPIAFAQTSGRGKVPGEHCENERTDESENQRRENFAYGSGRTQRVTDRLHAKLLFPFPAAIRSSCGSGSDCFLSIGVCVCVCCSAVEVREVTEWFGCLFGVGISRVSEGWRSWELGM